MTYQQDRRDAPRGNDRNLPAKAEKAPTVEEFQAELEEKAREYASILPPSIKVETFIAISTTAVKREPKLLLCDRLSLHTEVAKCAADGLVPDGREAVILYAQDNRKGCLVARYQPMIKGVRKIAWLHDYIIMDAEC